MDAATIVDPTATLEQFWCSDCRSSELFECIDGSATGSGWMCTSCGSGYFDALDRVLGTDPQDELVSAVQTG